AAVWGLVRTAQTEHPHRITLLDTDQPHTTHTNPTTTLTTHTDLDTTLTTALATALATGEPQLALRDHHLYAPRLTTT
ncbi:hypothetical protein, partial [Streptomyces sp. JWR5-1]|uniref:hypothetical protein n=1 Tax=Streptomyces sp. JWR5-1 TaxID=3122053 RepID=UPI0030158CCB